MSDILGWVGTVIMAVASIKIAHKKIIGLWLMLLGNVVFIVVGILSGLTSLIGVSILMGALDYYGIRCWNEDSEKTRDPSDHIPWSFP